jgi:uncharacterized protein (DUF1800 family)
MTPENSPSPAGRLARAIIVLTASIVAVGCSASAGVPGVTTRHLRLPSAREVALREQTADQQVQHVLNRVAFGPRPGDVQAVRAMGVDVWVARQLEPDHIDDGMMDTFLGRFPTLGKDGEQLLAQFPPPGQLAIQLAARQQAMNSASMSASAIVSGTPASPRPAVNAQTVMLTPTDSLRIKKANAESYRVTGEVATAKVARAVGSERQLDEVMTDFWENHFTVFAGKDRIRYFLPEYDAEVIRPHALGKFRDLLGAVAKSSAMLYYLDQWQSVADSGRPTLAMAPRVAAGTDARAKRVAQNPRLQQMTVGELIDNHLMPKAPLNRFQQLSPERLAELRKLTVAEAQVQLSQFAQTAAKRRPRGLNENYARELMELHTLGVDGGYTQQDVIEVARALTGWTIAKGANGGGFVFRGELHDAGAKTILGVKFPEGRGIEDGEEVLDILARSPATAHFIATKLARRFVSDSPPPALVARAAATFTRTDGDIRETLRTIVTSPEFFATAAYRAKVKSPFELVVSTMRAMGARPDSTPRIAQFVNKLGEPIFGHLTPDGYPEIGDDWMNTGSILNRINFGLAAAAGRVPGIKVADWIETKTLAMLSREQQVDGVIRTLLGGSASTDTRDVLLTGTNPFLQSQASQDTLRAMAKREMAGVSAMSGSALGALPAPLSTVSTARDPNQRADQRVNNVPLARQQQQAGRDVAKPGQGQSLTQVIGTVPNVTGLAQIIGLALGAPEFQRR